MLVRHAFLLLVLATAAPVYFAWTWSGQLGDAGNDATDYLLMAEHLSPYAKADAAVDFAAASSRFPPLYPLLLAWFDAAGPDLHRAHAMTTALFLVALVCWYAWLLFHGLGTAQAALLVLAVAAMPASWMIGLNIYSEYSYLLWSTLALLFLARYEARRRRDGLYAAALFCAAAALTRTVGVVLLLPLALAVVRDRRPMRVLALVLAVAPILVWHLLHRSDYGYGTALSGVYYGGDATVLRNHVMQEWSALQRGWEEQFQAAPALRLPLDLLGVWCLAGVAWRAVRLRPDAVYLAAYLAVLLIWPYPNVITRLLWPVVPFLLAQPLLLLAEFRRRGPGTLARPVACAASAALVLSAAVPAIAQASERYRAPMDGLPADARAFEGWYAQDPAHAVHRVFSQIVIVQALQRIPLFVPEGDCVIAPRTDLVSYYARRRSALPPLASVPDPYFMPQLRASGCRYVFMYSSTDVRFPVPLHPWQRLKGQVQVLDYIDVPDPPTGEAQARVVCILARLE